MKPEATETPIPSLNTSYPAGPFSAVSQPRPSLLHQLPRRPLLWTPSPARALTCPVLGYGQCGRNEPVTVPPILDRPRADECLRACVKSEPYPLFWA